MNTILLTLYQGDYHLGAAAMINSAVRQGFCGRIVLGHDASKLPAWTAQLEPVRPGVFHLEGAEILFRSIPSPRHFGFQKPFVMRQMLEEFPDCEQIFYVDPDILFLSPWKFFTEWAGLGVAYCLDCHFPYLSETHPWRMAWGRLITSAGHAVERMPGHYPNSGFVALPREQASFLKVWEDLTLAYEAEGGNTRSFQLEERHQPIVGDQDLMAASLMAWTGRESVIGPEGMGFTDYFYLLAHDIARPKAWRRNFIRQALTGVKPSAASAFFLEASEGPIRALPDLETRRFSFKVAQVISRVWKR
ncbi:hypothetical protein TSACC_3425 [Terrimicrobium sacchariphilum]|uniref:Glycosyl transferase family 8 n=1 Tax=Terrimicrobium sacchariphilum TaxID=690879 RepID=A0A146GDH1_TERSA|nr:hypothetical protein [Terrimicrobium sacchariphilum]GAT35360.1 hypothetical protein TSACC_3425 [Terrimicrobium sacchariphilum]